MLITKIKEKLLDFENKRIVAKSGLFDKEYYLDRYPDVKQSKIDPILHYLKNGYLEGRNPSANFNNDQYIKDNPEVLEAHINPLLHFIKYGSDNFVKQKIIIDKSGLFDRTFYLSMYPDVNASNTDPIIHYLKYGYLEGRNPSDKFYNDQYIYDNPEVRDRNINPLLHYIQHDFKEGLDQFGHSKAKETEKLKAKVKSEPKSVSKKQRLPVKDKATKQSNIGHIMQKPKVTHAAGVLISCHLAIEDPIIDMLCELAENFNADGVKVTFTGSVKLFAKRGFKSLIAKPFHLSTYTSDITGKAKVACNVWLEELLFNELVWRDKDTLLDSEKENLFGAVASWNNYFLNYRPSHVFVWGSTAPLSKLLIQLCKAYSVDYVIIERGHFPGTINVDKSGHGISSTMSAELSHFGSGGKISADIMNWFKTNKLSVPYKDYNRKSHYCRTNNKPVVFYMGANDKGSGTLIKDPFSISGVFNSTYDAVRYLHKLMSTSLFDVEFIFKAHPADKSDYSTFASESFIILENENVNRLIELADVCISTATTAFATCVLMDKAVISLGLSEFSEKGILYDCNHETEIPTQLRLALAQTGLAEKIVKGKAFIDDLFSRRLIGDNTIPTENKIIDLYNIMITKVLKTNKMVASRLELTTSINRKVCVIIPVYGDYVATKNCLDSVSNSPRKNVDVIIVNDCSPEQTICELVDEYSHISGISVYHNSVNLGFVGTVNKAICLAGNSDVILLNSDTVVASSWVANLQKTAYSDCSIATVTPVSNNASIFTIDVDENVCLDERYVETINEALFSQYSTQVIDVPIGHGFCLYIKRSAISRIGLFDDITFGKGYSEEVDFCLKAVKLGYKHVCSPSVFVAHVGGVSFSENAETQRIKNRAIIQDKYPSYFGEVSKFVKSNPISKIKINKAEL